MSTQNLQVEPISEAARRLQGALVALPQGFGEALQAVYMDARVRHLRDNTVASRVKTVNHFLRWASKTGFQTLEQVSPREVKAYYGEDQRGRNTVALSAVILKSCFNHVLRRPDLAQSIPKLRFKYEDDFDILTEEDIALMLKATDNLQWQLRLLMLWETGARAGEICSLRIQDVRLDVYGGVVLLRGKTRPRGRRLIKCVKLLEKHLREHPWSEDPGAPLFYAGRGSRRGHFIRIGTLRYMTVNLARRAGIKKKVWTHLIRHSAATSEASDFTDAELEELYGWVKGSGMPKRYRHKIDARKLEIKQLRLAGIPVPESETRSPLAPRICPRCSESNTPVARFCSRCNMVLDPKLAKELQAREDKAKALLDVLMNDEEVYQLMVRKIQEKGLE